MATRRSFLQKLLALATAPFVPASLKGDEARFIDVSYDESAKVSLADLQACHQQLQENYVPGPFVYWKRGEMFSWPDGIQLTEDGLFTVSLDEDREDG